MTHAPPDACDVRRPPTQVGKVGGLILGAQTAPQLALDAAFAGGLLDRPAWAAAARRCQAATSYAIAYQPSPGAATYGGRFTAAVELVRGRLGRGCALVLGLLALLVQLVLVLARCWHCCWRCGAGRV